VKLVAFHALISQHVFFLFPLSLQVYEVKQGSNVVERINLFIHKVTAPLHPKVEPNRPQNVKHLSHPFSREKQHL
jgi:hypothetical protein